MAEEFNSEETEKRLRPLARRLADRLANQIRPDEAFMIAHGLAKQIDDEFGFRLDIDDFARYRPRSPPAEGALVVNPDELFQSIVRTISFAREYHLGGVPTLAAENLNNRDEDTASYTIIDVFDRRAITKLAFAALPPFSPPPYPSEAGNQRLADWLGTVLSGHPWARITDEAMVIQRIGMSLSMFVARNSHARATAQSVTLSYSVNTQNSGLVLDAFPELQYQPRRFGTAASTPVHGNLSTGWWKFETVTGGALVRDKGRHLASSSSTSTITRDF